MQYSRVLSGFFDEMSKIHLIEESDNVLFRHIPSREQGASFVGNPLGICRMNNKVPLAIMRLE